ncbi:PilZ domain-containing protein [Nocardioides terrae]|uniref:PilZ domain-containing protein n=1 Tax=Nocardioides terrae TaxID=574651 RepID=A0A1I1NZR2_9ACTN|nr:PilZ domain-containing protein [Nocardioides terrae]SFD03184.1 PilZ domain-containing protein [Nocardioides terrae]
MPTALPPLHASLVLRDAEGRSWQSRLEALDQHAFTVGRPFDVPLEDAPEVGAAIEMTWTTEGGSYTLPTELTETPREGIVALWVLTPQGEATRAQRRAHFRLPMDGTGTITVAGGTITGTLADVSEGAVRFRLTPDEAEPFVEGASVSTTFSIGSESFEHWASVLRSWPSSRPNGDPAVDVVLILGLAEPQARELRRALIAEQVQRRRRGQD